MTKKSVCCSARQCFLKLYSFGPLLQAYLRLTAWWRLSFSCLMGHYRLQSPLWRYLVDLRAYCHLLQFKIYLGPSLFSRLWLDLRPQLSWSIRMDGLLTGLSNDALLLLAWDCYQTCTRHLATNYPSILFTYIDLTNLATSQETNQLFECRSGAHPF